MSASTQNDTAIEAPADPIAVISWVLPVIAVGMLANLIFAWFYRPKVQIPEGEDDVSPLQTGTPGPQLSPLQTGTSGPRLVLADDLMPTLLYPDTMSSKDANGPGPVAADTYLLPGSIFQAIHAGDVVLVRASWLLARAGYVKRNGNYHRGNSQADKFRIVPLPTRQQIESDHPDAILSAEELENLYARFCDFVGEAVNDFDGRTAEQDGVDALPVICISHCWEQADAADPEGRTLARVAAGLAPRMAFYSNWGFSEMGVFIDWCSLYQNKPTPRTKEQQACFERALSNMSMWYAHRLTTVFLITAQKLDVARESRGWPFYEEAVSRLFKDEPRGTRYRRLARATPDDVEAGAATKKVDGVCWTSDGPAATSSTTKKKAKGELKGGPMWRKVVDVDSNGRHMRGPPLAPTAFTTMLQGKRFTNGSDAAHVLHMYRKCIEDGFAHLSQLAYPRLGWNNDQLEGLAHALCEIQCPRAKLIKLTLNNMTDLSGLGRAFKCGALPSLEVLVLASCTSLVRLPDELSYLTELRSLILTECFQLEVLPTAVAHLPHLEVLDVRKCSSLPRNSEGAPDLPQELLDRRNSGAVQILF